MVCAPLMRTQAHSSGECLHRAVRPHRGAAIKGEVDTRMRVPGRDLGIPVTLGTRPLPAALALIVPNIVVLSFTFHVSGCECEAHRSVCAFGSRQRTL